MSRTNPPPLACPDDDTLRHFLIGDIPAERAAALDAHFAQCPRCGERAAGLSEDDTLGMMMSDGETLFESDVEKERSLVERLLKPEDSFDLSRSETAHTRHDQLFDFLQPAQAEDEVGRLGSFRVLEVLGQGGMGVVFRAEDVDLKRQVALKVIRRKLLRGQSGRERFLREARVAAALEHDHIVRVYQVGEDNDVPYLAMELLRGEPLSSRLQARRLSVEEMLRIGREIALGLAAAHEKSVVHRDIKPDNIWLESREAARRRERVRLLDFGLARITDDGEGMTQHGDILGTPAYMSPEQATGVPLDHRSDLFSLGSVLYRMATRRAPFANESTLKTLMAIRKETPERADQLNPVVPPELATLIEQLMAKQPDARPQSARHVARILASIERSLRNSSEKQTDAPPEPAPAQPGPAADIPIWRRPIPATLLTVAAVASAFAWLTSGNDPQRTVPDSVEVVVIQKPSADTAATRTNSGKVQPPASESVPSDSADPLTVTTPDESGDSLPRLSDAELTPFRGLYPVAPSRPDGSLIQVETVWPRGRVGSVSLSPDESLVACGSDDGIIRIYEFESRRLHQVLSGHAYEISSLAWHPSGRLLASGSYFRRELRVWSSTDGQLVARRDDMVITDLDWRPNGTSLAVGTGTGLWLLNPDGREIESALESDSAVTVRALEWSPDGTRLAIARPPRSVEVRDAHSWRVISSADCETGFVQDISWSPDAESIAIVVMQGDNFVWKIETDQLRSYPTQRKVGRGVAWNPNGDSIAFTANGGLEVVNARTMEIQQDWDGRSIHPDRLPFTPLAVNWSHDGQRMTAVGHTDYPRHGGIVTFDPQQPDGELFGPQLGQTLRAVSWSPDGNEVVVSTGGHPQLLNSKSSAVRTLSDSGMAAWCPTFNEIAVSRGRGDFALPDTSQTAIYSAKTGELLRQVTERGRSGATPVWSPDGNRLACFSRGYGRVDVWNRHSDETVTIALERATSDAIPVWWLDNSRLLIDPGNPHAVTVWDTDTALPVRSVTLTESIRRYHKVLAVIPETNQWLLRSSSERMAVAVEQDDQISDVRGVTAANCYAISRVGSMIAFGSIGEVTVFDADFETVQRFLGLAGKVKAVAWNQAGTTIMAVTDCGAIHSCNLKNGRTEWTAVFGPEGRILRIGTGAVKRDDANLLILMHRKPDGTTTFSSAVP